jgi:hypothetical protein
MTVSPPSSPGEGVTTGECRAGAPQDLADPAGPAVALAQTTADASNATDPTCASYISDRMI